MPVRLDDAPLPVDTPTFASAVAQARAAAEARRRVITEILLDGAPVPDTWLEPGQPPQPVPPASDLVFITADPVALVQASFRDAATGLDGVAARQEEAAKSIQRGQMDAAMPALSDIFTTWETARKVVSDGCSLLGLDPETLAAEIDGHSAPVPVGGAVRLLVKRLTEIKRCLTVRDWCGLSDVLAYDLPGDADLWRAMLRSLADRLPEIR